MTLAVDLGALVGRRLFPGLQEPAAGVVDEGNQVFFGGIGLQGKGVRRLRLLALPGPGSINLAEDRLKQQPGVLLTQPQVETIEGAMVRRGRQERIAAKPFDQ